MNSLELEQLLSRSPSESNFQDIVALLDSYSDSILSAAIKSTETALQNWPDSHRQAPEATWRRIQQGEQPPGWWSLVRSVRLAEGDSLAVGLALQPLTCIDASRVPVDPSPLSHAYNLRTLRLAENEGIISLDFLADMPRLETLVLSNLELLPDISPIGRLANLRVLDLSFNPTLEDISALTNLSALKWLDLSGDIAITDFSSISTLSNLETLVLNDCAEIQSVTFLENLKCLRRLFALRLPLLSDLHPLSSMNLEHLHIGGSRVSDGVPLGQISSLIELMLIEMPYLQDLTFLNHLQKLKSLGIVACQAPLPALGLPILEDLLIGDCPNVQDLSGLVGLRSLRELSLRGLSITDLTPLAQLPQLESVSLSYCTPGLDISSLPSGCQVIQ